MTYLPDPATGRPFRAARADGKFLGLLFNDMTLDETVLLVSRAGRANCWRYVVTPNAAHLGRLRRQALTEPTIYDNAWLRLLDSRVIAATARLAGLRPPRVVTGADLVAKLLLSAPRADRLCIVGCASSVVERLRSRFGLSNISHFNPSHGFWRCSAELEEAARFVIESQASLTFLALGSPQQEILADLIMKMGGARGVGICCGAAVEFAAGAKARAPVVLQRLCLEWAFRLCAEPRRMARRYFVESPHGIAMVLREAIDP